MKIRTKEMITSLAEMDGTITSEQLLAGLKALAGEMAATAVFGTVSAKPIDRLLSVCQVAEILNLSTKSVLRYCKDGLLRRVIRRGGIRATGIAESSVRAFISGEEAT